jgi:hypothetical protein
MLETATRPGARNAVQAYARARPQNYRLVPGSLVRPLKNARWSLPAFSGAVVEKHFLKTDDGNGG